LAATSDWIVRRCIGAALRAEHLTVPLSLLGRADEVIE
jgi:hypothetical protein